MKVTFPHMGNLQYMLSDLLERLEVDYVVPPPTTERTLALGVKLSPEFACLPLKVTLGNMMEALEAGADTIIMAGGVGPCRFGFYGEIQKRLLEAAGYDHRMVIFEPPQLGWARFFGYFRELAPEKSARQIWQAVRSSWAKARAIDRLEKRVLAERCYEVDRGSMTRAWREGVKMLAAAGERSRIDELERTAQGLLDDVPRDMGRPVLNVGIIGEFYVLLEPFVNLEVERFLGENGCRLERSVYVTDWVAPRNNNAVGGVSYKEIARAASPYLNHTVGGEGLPSVGHAVVFARHGFDGLLHLFPFTCMPDTIAKSILPRVSEDQKIPFLSLAIDEQTGRAGVTTRLEAFLDLMRAKRERAGAA